MIQYKQILITLALLLTAVTGAWATTDGVIIKELTVPSAWNNDETYLTVDEMTGFKDFSSLTEDEAKALLNSVPTGKVVIIYGAGASSNSFKLVQYTGDQVVVGETPLSHGELFYLKDEYKYYYTASDGIEVTPVAEPAANTKQWTFSMPGSDVVLTPQYAPAAQLDENGAPAAVSGLEIAADAAIITAGQSAQGTLLYAVGTSENEKPALTDFSATLPNAKDQTAAGTYYVWYYIQGHDTPQGQEPTADNTFNDSEIMGPVTVELLTNEHTLNIKQSPNITVTVAGTAKTPTDDKVTPVTTGQEVKIKANTGYKLRKVEVKKKAKTITIGGTYSATLDIEGCTTWQQVVEKNSTLIRIWDQNYITNLGTYMVLMKGNYYVAPGDNIDPTATDYTFVDAPF